MFKFRLLKQHRRAVIDLKLTTITGGCCHLLDTVLTTQIRTPVAIVRQVGAICLCNTEAAGRRRAGAALAGSRRERGRHWPVRRQDGVAQQTSRRPRPAAPLRAQREPQVKISQLAHAHSYEERRHTRREGACGAEGGGRQALYDAVRLYTRSCRDCTHGARQDAAVL